MAKTASASIWAARAYKGILKRLKRRRDYAEKALEAKVVARWPTAEAWTDEWQRVDQLIRPYHENEDDELAIAADVHAALEQAAETGRAIVEVAFDGLPFNDRRATAFHEAGHAVVGYYLGLGPKIATIVPEPNAAGRVRSTKRLPYLPNYTWRHCA